MAKTLGGSLFIKDGNKFDYCFKESIRCLLEFCDKVVICVVPTDDGTYETVLDMAAMDKRILIRGIKDADWHHMAFQTKHRLSIFTNYAIEMLDTDYVFNLQSDEILDPSSYEYVRKAIEEGQEGYLCSRINLWGSPYTQLNVPHERKPCSTEIVRLAKTCYRAYDDAESIAAPVDSKYLEQIKIWHMGFVRKREVHPAKIREMQGDIFKCGVDSKLEGMEVFDSTKWFTSDDLIPIQGELPPLIQKWAKERE
jgi:glycosyltransferase involved in cell wall biosynthesis